MHHIATRRAAYQTGAKKLFAEALNIYLKAMRERNILIGDDKELVLIAIHGLIELDNYPLARVLVRAAFTYMTPDELEGWYTRARRTFIESNLVIPF